MRFILITIGIGFLLAFSPILAEEVLNISVERLAADRDPVEYQVHAVIIDEDALVKNFQAAIRSDATIPPSTFLKQLNLESYTFESPGMRKGRDQQEYVNLMNNIGEQVITPLKEQLSQVSKVRLFVQPDLESIDWNTLLQNETVEISNLTQAKDNGTLLAVLFADPDPTKNYDFDMSWGYKLSMIKQSVLDVKVDTPIIAKIYKWQQGGEQIDLNNLDWYSTSIGPLAKPARKIKQALTGRAFGDPIKTLTSDLERLNRYNSKQLFTSHLEFEQEAANFNPEKAEKFFTKFLMELAHQYGYYQGLLVVRGSYMSHYNERIDLSGILAMPTVILVNDAFWKHREQAAIYAPFLSKITSLKELMRGR